MTAESMFAGFLAKAKAQSTSDKPGISDDHTCRHLQVRLSSGDARRFKHQAENRGLSVQDALVTAVNELMWEWEQDPCRNPGTTRKRGPGK